MKVDCEYRGYIDRVCVESRGSTRDVGGWWIILGIGVGRGGRGCWNYKPQGT